MNKPKNLILQWIRQCTPAQSQRIAQRIDDQLALSDENEKCDEGPSSTRIIATVLFVECAEDLELTPLELHGLLDSPQCQCMEAVASLAVDRIRRAPDNRPRFQSVAEEVLDFRPVV